MARETCYRCFWPKPLCWCGSIAPIATRTRFVLLMHPKEFKREKAATGRLTHLCLADSEIQMGVGFEDHADVRAILSDPASYPVLLYPGKHALNLTHGELAPSALQGRRLTVFMLDATWSLARKMLKLSPALRQLPRIMFTPSGPSRYVIKQQPREGCLSTLEAADQLLRALEQSGLDRYDQPDQMLQLFGRMQDHQIRCACDPEKTGYRRRAYSQPGERRRPQGRSGERRTRMFLSL